MVGVGWVMVAFDHAMADSFAAVAAWWDHKTFVSDVRSSAAVAVFAGNR
jgi:hypothetical protein